MSLTLAILDLQARVQSLEAKLEELKQQAPPAPRPDKRKAKRKRKAK